ncbi:MAG TPA: hypothetical protein VG106_03135, partial [Vicinamibacterales bacterium]|nr:hypothetical protein [Vicinamibacterales bacterium]
KRAFSNDSEYQAWRVANGYYALYDAARTDASFLAQVDAIRQAHSLTYSYRANGLITEAIDQRGLRTLYKYDNKENLIAITDRNGWGAAHSDASDFRRLRAELGFTDATGAGKLAADLTPAERDAILAKFTTTLTYDERGNLLSRVDAEGNRATFTYTPFNKLASETSAVGHALTSSDEPLYREQRVALGFAALVANLSDADKLALLARHTTTYQYDARQNLVQRTDAGGDVTRFEYDANGNLERRIVFLDRNDLVDPAKQQVTRFFYDQFGNNIETLDGEGHRTRSDYDLFGNLLRFIDGNGGVTTYTYDKADRLLTITDPEGHVTVNAYDAVGNRIAVTDANGHTVTRLYDRNNMLLAVIDPSDTAPAQDRTTRHAYDVTGNRTSVTDAEGRTTTYTYSARRELVEITTPEVPGPDGVVRRYTTTFAYDGESNRIRTTNNNGFTTEVAYTRDNLVRTQTDPNGHITVFEYDANRNQVMIVAGAQLPELRRQIVRFRYDAEDQLIRQIDALGNATQFTYDAPGNRVRVVDANGNATRFEYDKNNRLVREIRPAALDGRTGSVVEHT